VHLIENLAGDWRRLDERIESLSSEIEAIARQDAGCAIVEAAQRPVMSATAMAVP
jgi:cell division protein FtsL